MNERGIYKPVSKAIAQYALFIQSRTNLVASTRKSEKIPAFTFTEAIFCLYNLQALIADAEQGYSRVSTENSKQREKSTKSIDDENSASLGKSSSQKVKKTKTLTEKIKTKEKSSVPNFEKLLNEPIARQLPKDVLQKRDARQLFKHAKENLMESVRLSLPNSLAGAIKGRRRIEKMDEHIEHMLITFSAYQKTFTNQQLFAHFVNEAANRSEDNSGKPDDVPLRINISSQLKQSSAKGTSKEKLIFFLRFNFENIF